MVKITTFFYHIAIWQIQENRNPSYRARVSIFQRPRSSPFRWTPSPAWIPGKPPNRKPVRNAVRQPSNQRFCAQTINLPPPGAASPCNVYVLGGPQQPRSCVLPGARRAPFDFHRIKHQRTPGPPARTATTRSRRCGVCVVRCTGDR